MDITETLRQLRDGSASTEALRALLRYESFWVPLDEASAPELRDDGEKLYLTAYTDEIEGPASMCSGRTLMRTLPIEAAGIVLDPDEDHAVSLVRSALPEVLRLADALDLEDALLGPAPGQRDRLLTASWSVWTREGMPSVIRQQDLRVVPLFTAPDRAESWRKTEPSFAGHTLQSIEGKNLFQALGERSDYDGLLFDPGALKVAPVGPSFSPTLRSGRDERPGADVLPARTIAEIHLWLDLMSVPRTDRTHVVAQHGDTLCAIYTVTLPVSGRTRVPFALTEPRQDPLDLGEGTSQILCAALVADALRTRMLGLPDNPAHADGSDRERAAFAARLAWELEKLLGDRERLPRNVVRTALGARLLRERPEIGSMTFVRGCRSRAEAILGTV